MKWNAKMSENVLSLKARKGNPQAEKIVAITAYDYTFAKLVDSWVDMVLVGDSLGMVVQGNPNTLSVSLEEMIYHAKAVRRGTKRAHLAVDMPFLSYRTGMDEAIKNAGRLLSESGAEAVKLEGGRVIGELVKKLVDFGIPVLGHVGLTPQSVHAFGGFKVQGKTETTKAGIWEDVKVLEQAGVYAIVLEGMPSSLAKAITENLQIPTIGIGAGVHCDGQILVNQDLLGMDPDFRPRFVKRYSNLGEQVVKAIKSYAGEVRNKQFPEECHSF